MKACNSAAASAAVQVREVLDTFRVAARLGNGSLAAYVISMSQAASDVLAVELLQKEARTMVRTRIPSVCGMLASGQMALTACTGHRGRLHGGPPGVMRCISSICYVCKPP